MATLPVPLHRAALRRATCLAGAILLLPAATAAQVADGFLFRPPVATLTVRAGPMQHTAGGDLLGQFRRDLTLDRTDFAAMSVGLDLTLVPLAHWDLVLSVSHARLERGSEFSDFVDEAELPIEQVTSLATTPITASVRYLLAPRGRSVGRTAWVPTSTVPWVGAGGGVVKYNLSQDGEFIDFRDDAIFLDHLETRGSALALHALAGVEHWLTPRLGLSVEARYTWSRANPGQDFRSFESLDLGGVHATVGLSLRW